MYMHTHKINSSNLSGKLEYQLPNLGDTGQGAPQIPHAGQTMVQLQVYQSTEVPFKAIPELLVFNLPCPNAQHMGTAALLCPSYSRRLRLGSWSSK